MPLQIPKHKPSPEGLGVLKRIHSANRVADPKVRLKSDQRLRFFSHFFAVLLKSRWTETEKDRNA